jgi:hypothetical protein
MAFDDTDGPDDRHELAADDILREIKAGELETPIEIDDYFIDNVNSTGAPVWDGRHVARILDYLDEVEPGHGIIDADFQLPPGER